MRLILLGAVLACAAFGASPNAPQVFKSGVQSVIVDASVLDGRSPLASLTAADFALTDNGAAQRVESLQGTAIPLDVSLVVDATWFTQGLTGGLNGPAGTRELHSNAQQIVGLLRPDDRLGIITYAADLVETRPMSRIGSTPAGMDVGNPTTHVPRNPVPIGQALLTALTAPTPADRRHIIILFSAARLQSEVLLVEDIVPAAIRADALLYTVLNPPDQAADTHQPIPIYPPDALVRDGLTQVAVAAGGKTYLTGDIVGAFRDILKEFRRSYVLRYSLQGVPTRGWHSIVVTVPSCPRCTIRARRGYLGT